MPRNIERNRNIISAVATSKKLLLTNKISKNSKIGSKYSIDPLGRTGIITDLYSRQGRCRSQPAPNKLYDFLGSLLESSL